jgi:hypothetical protein
LANQNGNGVSMLLQLQGQAINPNTYKIREKPKNYLNANCTKIKTIIRKVKERENAKKQPVKVLWKAEQYKNVQSKLKEILEVIFDSKNNSMINLINYNFRNNQMPQENQKSF